MYSIVFSSTSYIVPSFLPLPSLFLFFFSFLFFPSLEFNTEYVKINKNCEKLREVSDWSTFQSRMWKVWFDYKSWKAVDPAICTTGSSSRGVGKLSKSQCNPGLWYNWPFSPPLEICTSPREAAVWNKILHLISLKELIGLGTKRKNLQYIFVMISGPLATTFDYFGKGKVKSL